MGKTHELPLEQELVEWIHKQHLFFVSTAPVDTSGHINVSPKSAKQFRFLRQENCAQYLDLSGSGNETSAHLQQNSRITVMFVALEGSPRILRLFGHAQVLRKQELLKNDPDGHLLRYAQEDLNDPGFRAIVHIKVHRVSTSCGFSVPIYSYQKERSTLREASTRMEQGPGMDWYRAKKNYLSIDGYLATADPDHPTPSRVVNEEGFNMCYYDDDDTSVLASLRRIKMYVYYRLHLLYALARISEPFTQRVLALSFVLGWISAQLVRRGV